MTKIVKKESITIDNPEGAGKIRLGIVLHLEDGRKIFFKKIKTAWYMRVLKSYSLQASVFPIMEERGIEDILEIDEYGNRYFSRKKNWDEKGIKQNQGRGNQVFLRHPFRTKKEEDWHYGEEEK